MNAFIEVLRVQGTRISLKINVKKTKSRRLSEDEKMCSIPLYMDHFDGLRLKEHRRGNWRPGIKWGGKTLLDLDYADDLSKLDESVSK